MERVPSALVVVPYLKLQQAIYKGSGGRIGRRMAGAPTLLLTTTGRRSGQQRVNALSYLRDGDAWVVVASNGGSDKAPAWLHNLRARPEVEVQDRTERWTARAHEADADERARLWPLVNRNNRGLAPLLHPGAKGRYDAYQRHTDREIPVVVLDPVDRITG